MKLFRELAALGAVAAMALIFATPAAAQATRTWISGVGDDVNPCSRTAPCKTFAGAISKTAAGGEIDCLDPGGFGTVTITKGMTLDCHLVFGSVLASGTQGVIVNVPTGTFVNLIGLAINGAGTTPGSTGVRVVSGTVLITRSEIYGFNTGTTCGTITGTGMGVCVNGPAGAKLTIEDSEIRNNGYGVVNSPSAGANQVVINHSLLDGNTTVNVQNAGAGAKTFFNADTLINCPTATASTAGSFSTYGNNVMTGTVATMTAVPLQ